MPRERFNLHPKSHATYLTRDGHFYLVFGIPDDDEFDTLVVWGSEGSLVPWAHRCDDPFERLVENARAKGYRASVAPAELDLHDAKGRRNLLDIYALLSPRARAVFEIDPGAGRAAHRVSQEIRASVERVSKRIGGRRALREATAHRDPDEQDQLLDAHRAMTMVVGWLEVRTAMRTAWNGSLAYAHHRTEGEMSFEGDLKLNRKTLPALERLAEARPARRAGSRADSVAGRQHYLTMLHEALHAVSPIDTDEYEAAPRLEEALAELLAVSLYPELMSHLFGYRLERPAPEAYLKSCRAMNRLWRLVARGRGARAEAEFYLSIFRERTNRDRIRAISRELYREGFERAEARDEAQRAAKFFRVR